MRWPFGKRLRERVATLEDHRDAVLVRLDGIQAHHFQHGADLCSLYSHYSGIQKRLEALHFALRLVMGCDIVEDIAQDGKMTVREFTGKTPLVSRIEALERASAAQMAIIASLAPKSTPSVKRKISPSKRKRAK